MSLPLPAPECSIYYPELDNNPGIIINPRRKSKQGFTLIELSIVLVIIGLIVGGVLVGRDLISAATVRSQITQIEKYNTAANTFRGKYGYLPGDIKDPDASNFGFYVRGPYKGEGDGDGIINGSFGLANASIFGTFEAGGETLMFWQDLAVAHLIDMSTNTKRPVMLHRFYLSAVSLFSCGEDSQQFRVCMERTHDECDGHQLLRSIGRSNGNLGGGGQHALDTGADHCAGLQHRPENRRWVSAIRPRCRIVCQ